LPRQPPGPFSSNHPTSGTSPSANAYAASHRFSVNQALGVMEVCDENATQNGNPPLNQLARSCVRLQKTGQNSAGRFRSPMIAATLACLPACLLACLPACLLACLPACQMAAARDY
jgi:hypothetical protein